VKRRALFPLGLLLGLIVIFSLFDLVGPRPREAAEVETWSRGPASLRPELSREGDTIVIDSGFIHTSRFRYGGDSGQEEADALLVCLEEGVEREFGPEDAPINPFEGTEKRTHARKARLLMDEIKDQCLERLSSDF